MIVWNQSLEMGVEALDQEHQELFRIARQMLDRMDSRGHEASTRKFVLREGLRFINGYFDSNAAREEVYMKQIGYEGYALHRMLHDDFRRVQLSKYEKLLEKGDCTREDVWNFIGYGVGWLLEHVATADLAIVGKGVFSQPPKAGTGDATALEREINQLFTATLNIQAHAKIISQSYQGESFGKTLAQKFTYQKDGQTVTVISGIERSFLLDVAKMFYGDEVQDETELILSTVESFSSHFWESLSRQTSGYQDHIKIGEHRFLVGRSLPDELQKIQPELSVLFTSDNGKFFLACDHKDFFLPEAVGA